MILFSNKDDIAFCEMLREANSLVVELTTAGADAEDVLSSDDDPSHLDEIYTPPDQLHFWSCKFGISLLEDAIIKTLDTSN